MNPQLALPLALQASTRFADFVAGENQMLLDTLHQQRTTSAQALIYLSGEANSGKTHLLMAQCNAAEHNHLQASYLPCTQLLKMSPDILQGLEHSHLLAIDDIHRLAGDSAWEEALFGLFNRARELNCRLLFSAEQIPGKAGFLLPDLISRLSWGLIYQLKPLKDAEREDFLISLSTRHGLDMSKEVARYLIQRQPRDIEHLINLVERLDKASLQEQRCLTVPFVRNYL